MGAYNTLSISTVCPRCDQPVDVVVQFKYGDVRQHGYHLFDELRWGGNDFGRRGAARVVVDGVAEGPCPACHYSDERNFYVYVERDRIVGVEPAVGAHNFVAAGNTYIVLRE